MPGWALKPAVQQEAAVEFENEKGESFARVRLAVTTIKDGVETHIGGWHLIYWLNG